MTSLARPCRNGYHDAAMGAFNMLDAHDVWDRKVSHSPIVRKEIHRLKTMVDNQDPGYLDAYIRFLTMVTRLFPPPPPREPFDYPNVKL